jgi:hypothetical protein
LRPPVEGKTTPCRIDGEPVDVALIDGARHEIDLAANVLTDWSIMQASYSPPIAAPISESISTEPSLSTVNPQSRFMDALTPPQSRFMTLPDRTRPWQLDAP